MKQIIKAVTEPPMTITPKCWKLANVGKTIQLFSFSFYEQEFAHYILFNVKFKVRILTSKAED